MKFFSEVSNEFIDVPQPKANAKIKLGHKAHK